MIPRLVNAGLAKYCLRIEEASDIFAPRARDEFLALFEGSAEVEIIDTLPGVGLLLAVVIRLEVGEVSRFASAGKLTGYSGTVPRLHQSGTGPARQKSQLTGARFHGCRLGGRMPLL